MPELVAVVDLTRDKIHEERKFLAALKGIDLDKETAKVTPKNQKKQKGSGNAWEDMKARANSRGLAGDGNDVLSLSGSEAARQGFGIGMGLDFENAVDPAVRAEAESKARKARGE